MAALIDRIVDARARKDFAPQPDFWSLPEVWWRPAPAEEEWVENDFEAYVDRAYKDNGIVAACITARLLPFSEARFQFQELRDGRPGRLFGTPDLALLEEPWQNATTGDLLARMEQDASLAGNAYITPVDGHLRRLRPDWVRILSGVRGDPDSSPFDLRAEILGYVYDPKPARGPRPDPVLITPDRMVHYAPLPDPMAQWRGMSWLTPILREISADTEATKHKLSYFQRGAALNVVITYDKSIPAADLPRYQAIFDQAHQGSANAYRTLHLGGGADAKALGADLKSIDFKAVQGGGETRIAAAAGVGAIIARLSEGLAGSSLNSGNYNAAKRQFADMTLRPLWRSAAGSLAKIVTVPAGARLWYDVRDVEFLKEDRKDAAEILSLSAQTVRQLVDAGYDPDAVIDAVEAGDLSRLTGQHSGLFSVQLQPAGEFVTQGGAT
jgi:phage portal protein BeeE